MSQPTHGGHASMPRFIVWVQDHLLLTLLMIASGYINGLMLTEGWVPNIEDPHSWGIFHGIGLGILFAAGGAMGGLTVRVGYKLSECVQNRQGGRAVFLAFGLAALSLIEFWASFSQRAPNLHPTSADSLLPWPPFAFSATAILIAAVLPFTSMFWGFTAEDPAPKAVEDPALVRQRMENQLIEAEGKARIVAARAKGWGGALKGAVDAARQGVEEAVTAAPEIASMDAEVAAQESVEVTPVATNPAPKTAGRPVASGIPKGWWTAEMLVEHVRETYGVGLAVKRAATTVAAQRGAKKADTRGTPNIARARDLTAWARETYVTPNEQPADMGAGVVPEMAE